jgi:hypothetical protein
MNQRRVMISLAVVVFAFGLILSCTIPGSAQEIVTLTDMTGAAVKLTTFAVQLDKGMGDFSQRVVRRFYGEGNVTHMIGMRIYLQPPAIPVRLANGVFEFVTFDKVGEYQSDGKSATVTLVDGGRVTGSPLAECTFKGKGALGEVSLSAHDVRSLKFSVPKAKEYFDAHSSDEMSTMYSVLKYAWPDKDKAKAILTLVSGDEIRLQSPVFIFEESLGGCDDSYIPCKPFHSTDWAGKGGMPVKYGTMEVELDFKKTQSIELSDRAKPATTPPGFTVTLLGGEKIAATLNLDKGSKAIGLLGTTENGFAHVPMDRIKSITF